MIFEEKTRPLPPKRLYDKSRVRGDFHARFCERNGVKLPVPTRLRTSSETERCGQFESVRTTN